MLKRLLASCLDRSKTIGGHASEYGDHLSVTVIDALQPLANLLHRGWQNPFPERSTVAQGTGFASEDKDVMPGIIDGIAAAKAALMFRDRHPILLDDDPVRIGMKLDGATNGSRQDRVFAVVEADGAGLRHRGRNAVEAIEWANVAHEAAAFGFEHLPNCLRRLFGLAMSLGIGNAFIEQPDIQFLQAFDSETRRKKLLAHKADLVLDLSLLPAGCWRAGYGVDEIMAAHLQETAIVEPFLADKDSLHRRLHVMGWTPPSEPSE